MTRTLAALALLAGLGYPEPAAIVLRQPAYGSARPGYALVVFGADERCRVWLVSDGRALYVDRNGNRDLTEPDECVEPDDRGDYVCDVLACDRDGRKGTYRLRVTPAADGEEAGIKYLSVHPVEDIQRFHSTAGIVRFGRTPEDAPVIPIDGPLRFVLMDHWTGATTCRILPPDGGEHEFSILVATPIRGTEEEAYVYPNLWALQGGDLPDVRAEFEPREPGSATLVPSVHVWQCDCARRYRCTVDVPPATATRSARLVVSVPGWRYGELKPATFELRYGDATAE